METPPSPENNESQVEQLLGELDNYALDQFPEEIQDQLAEEWDDAEMEARVGKDRDGALERLRQFIDKLSKLSGRDEQE